MGEQKPMKKLGNLVLGAALATVCLAPTAWSDAGLFAERAQSRAIAFEMMHPLAHARAAFPGLISEMQLMGHTVVKAVLPAGVSHGA